MRQDEWIDKALKCEDCGSEPTPVSLWGFWLCENDKVRCEKCFKKKEDVK